MKLSLKVEYACQVLAQLGRSYGDSDLPHIEQLAQAECIPSNYLVQILNDLRTAGLIISKRGKQGGYALSKPPAEITLHAIVTAVDGAVLEFSEGNGGASSPRVLTVWRDVAQMIDDKTRSITVEDMMVQSSKDMWYI
ncbi:MAG: Rrf2 family transcriptional regulator [Verrucomicrobia bacterium]|nr:Rrf2 family transcriptional regulator [Verrucomicrobiota bacterium]